MDRATSVHIEYDPTGEDLDYHRKMIGNIVALLRPIFGSIGLRSYFEDRLLPRLVPFQSHSLVVLAEAMNIVN